jgi:hypothetical protein
MLKIGMLGTIKNTIMHPLVAGPLGGGIVVLLAYLDSKYKDGGENSKDSRDSMTYLKLFIVSSLVVSSIIYFVSSENNKTKSHDEFLNQSYDTSAPTLLPKSKGGYSVENQSLMNGPKENIEKMMGGLPPVGTWESPPNSSSKSHSNVSMKIRPSHCTKLRKKIN